MSRKRNTRARVINKEPEMSTCPSFAPLVAKAKQIHTRITEIERERRNAVQEAQFKPSSVL